MEIEPAPWDIWYLPSAPTIPTPKPKYVVVVHTDSDSAHGFYINSEITLERLRKQHLVEYQLEIDPLFYASFLSRSSFIDALYVEQFDLSHFAAKVGEVYVIDRARIVQAIRTSPGIKPWQRKLILPSIENVSKDATQEGNRSGHVGS